MFNKKFKYNQALILLIIFSFLFFLIFYYRNNQIDKSYPSYVKEFLDFPTEFSENKCDEECLLKRIDTVNSKIEAVTINTNLKIESLNNQVTNNKKEIEKNKKDLDKITKIFKKVAKSK